MFLDLETLSEPWTPPEQIETAVICAAVSALLPCEKDPLAASRINVRGPLLLARGLVAQQSHIVFLSTNQVFDGATPEMRSDEPCRPHSVYGKTKAEAEEGLRQLPTPLTVVRFGKILEPDCALLKGWEADLRAGKTIRPFRDLMLAPVSLRFAVDILVRVADSRVLGAIQVAADRDVTYLDVAHYIARKVGAPASLVQDAHSSEAGFPQHCVPLHTTLETSRLRGELGLTPPDVWATIDEVLGLGGP